MKWWAKDLKTRYLRGYLACRASPYSLVGRQHLQHAGPSTGLRPGGMWRGFAEQICRHSYFAFIPGFSVRTYTDDQLFELEAREHISRSWRGKDYFPYEASSGSKTAGNKNAQSESECEAFAAGRS